ncbi:hypothetical protein QJS04_geneDACA004226 [Acorus gramineus]|uniref:Reverse transcriptase n=1 Tax=Acorus gramineus TaxID=55184 RepID=A0AAV9B1G9_ACOGR|nr:hypothetical protein QJS04_geneDACA004226 [Acorus gramineus]
MLSTNSEIFLIAIYGSNSAAERLSLWHDLCSLAARTSSSPWIVGGDFNEVCYAHKKRGGRGAHTRRMLKFNNCISECFLQDLKAVGGLFSWSNNQVNRIACKLDRTLVNNQWKLEFLDSFVNFMAPSLSDHSMLLVTVKPNIISGPKPFKYFQCWEEHPGFSELVESAWRLSMAGSPISDWLKDSNTSRHILSCGIEMSMVLSITVFRSPNKYFASPNLNCWLIH